MKTLFLSILIFFFSFSLYSSTIIFLPANSDPKEIQQTFLNAGWDTAKLIFCFNPEECKTPPHETVSKYELKISDQDDSYQMTMSRTQDKTSLYQSKVPIGLKKNALENFEKFLGKQLLLENILSFSNSDSKQISKAPYLFSNKEKLAVGEPIELGFETYDSGFVYVVLISANGGDPILLFPNNSQKVNFVENPGKTWISSKADQLKASKPLGKETIRLIQSEVEWNDFDLKPIPNSRFNTIVPKKDKNKKSALKDESKKDEFEDKVKASSEISWEIIAR